MVPGETQIAYVAGDRILHQNGEPPCEIEQGQRCIRILRGRCAQWRQPPCTQSGDAGRESMWLTNCELLQPQIW
jgi:hypothetical protein